MHNRIDWEDLRYVLAVADARSLAAAARALGVNHTTVLRRVNAFESRLGVRLFERLPSGYALTASGEELLATARNMAETVTALERKLAGQDLRLEGSLRVTTTDTLMISVLPPIFAAFCAAHPGVRVEIAISNAMANLTKRDADIAIRPAPSPPETLIGRRISGLGFAVYAAPVYLEPRAAVTALEDHAWIAPDDTLSSSAVAIWMRRQIPTAPIALRSDSLVAIREAAAAGLGVAALPCYLADPDARLRRLQRIDDLRTELWILTHEDLRHTARVRAFTEFASTALAKDQDLLEGRELQ